MDTSTLKTFAPAVRRQLMEAVTRKLDFVLAAKTPDYLTTFAKQVAALRELERQDRAGLIERVAYTWFNRLTALRYLDARGWHPFRARVITAASAAETQPDLLKLTRSNALPEELQRHTDSQRLNDLLDGRIKSDEPQGEVYRHLVLASCRFYHAILPDVFEKLDDETELLLPDDLLTEQSVVQKFRTEITDADCAEVEVLGWLYQFYISEKKATVMARKKAVPTEDIPAVTQLFTPHWIVRYLVENSLGRLWLLNHPGSKLREQMPYYIEGKAEADLLKIEKPEDIRLLDPAAGSGHMLTYAFDLLYLIYEEEGYAPTEIPALILKHNLHGLEICPRAAQLAELALVFKAREKSRRFFQSDHLVRPRIIELRDVRFAENELRDYIHALGLGDLFKQPVLKLLHQFEEAKNFGSLIQPCLDDRTIAFIRQAIEAKDLGGQLFLRDTHLKVLRVLEQAEALTPRYHVVVANPPYMGAGGMNAQLRAFTANSFPEGKADLMTCFMSRCEALAVRSGRIGMINLPSWLFLSSFEKLRIKLIRNQTIESLLHLGRGIFGSDFGTVAFTLSNEPRENRAGVYRRLFSRAGDVDTPEAKENLFLDATFGRFETHQNTFNDLPGSPIAYWTTPRMRQCFRCGTPLGELVEVKIGMRTGDNNRFLRRWTEVSNDRFGLGYTNAGDANASELKWFPYNKGGEYRRWYGNNELVVNWQNNGEEIKANTRAVYPQLGDNLGWKISNESYYFRPALSWTATSISYFGIRHSDAGFLFDVKGSSCFTKDEDHSFVLGLLSSRLVSDILACLNPTIEFQTGNIATIPVVAEVLDPAFKASATRIVDEAVVLARAAWDNFETSWDFRDQPLLRPALKSATLEASWRNWEAQSTAVIRRMQELETENNRLFIAAYGLDGELQPEVPEAQITLARAEARRDMAAFLSYAVGCMMGRYSPDHPGLILANAGDSLREFLEKVGKPLAELTFAPDEDGIIPVLDGEWFEDDIVARTRDFLRATFGEATLRENVRFLDESLGKDLRKYFLTDFYKDHLQTYKKRPIYWLIQSPKKGFSVLIYLHRYTRDTINLVLNRYLRDYLTKLRSRLAHLAQVQVTAINARDKTEARKEADKLTKTLHECEEWERQTILPLAQQRIELDLDDGVKVNYLKIGEALAPIAGLAAKDEE